MSDVWWLVSCFERNVKNHRLLVKVLFCDKCWIRFPRRDVSRDQWERMDEGYQNVGDISENCLVACTILPSTCLWHGDPYSVENFALETHECLDTSNSEHVADSILDAEMALGNVTGHSESDLELPSFVCTNFKKKKKRKKKKDKLSVRTFAASRNLTKSLWHRDTGTKVEAGGERRGHWKRTRAIFSVASRLIFPPFVRARAWNSASVCSRASRLDDFNPFPRWNGNSRTRKGRKSRETERERERERERETLSWSGQRYSLVKGTSLRALLK